MSCFSGLLDTVLRHCPVTSQYMIGSMSSYLSSKVLSQPQSFSWIKMLFVLCPHHLVALDDTQSDGNSVSLMIFSLKCWMQM